MHRITSDEFQKELDSYMAIAHREAVIITSHRQNDPVLISADEYKRFRELEQQSLYVQELPESVINEIGKIPIPEATHWFDDEFRDHMNTD